MTCEEACGVMYGFGGVMYGFGGMMYGFGGVMYGFGGVMYGFLARHSRLSAAVCPSLPDG